MYVNSKGSWYSARKKLPGEARPQWLQHADARCIRQHTRGRSGRFSERSALIKHGDTVAAVVEFKSEREADDSSSSDAQVGVMHGISLVGFGERL